MLYVYFNWRFRKKWIGHKSINVCNSLPYFSAGGTETVAVEQTDGTYKLYGYKWFSSATDADMALTLARILDQQGNTVKVGSNMNFINLAACLYD